MHWYKEHHWVIREEYLSITTDQSPIHASDQRWKALHAIPNSSKPPSHLKIEVLHQSDYGPPLLKRLWLRSLCLWFIEYALLPFSAFHRDMTRLHTVLVKSFKWTGTSRFAISLGVKIFIWSFFCPLVWELWHLDRFNRYPRGRTRKEDLRSPSCLF